MINLKRINTAWLTYYAIMFQQFVACENILACPGTGESEDMSENAFDENVAEKVTWIDFC